MKIEEIQSFLNTDEITVVRLREHSKASEKYVDVVFHYKNQNDWEGSIPYYYRRTALFLDNPKDVSSQIKSAYESLKESNSQEWLRTEKKLWETEYLGKAVTKPFFDKLLNFKWNCVDGDLPQNPNWARRIQDIKEMGYTLATDTNKFSETLKKKTTHILLVPLKKGAQTGYEIFSPVLRKRIIKVLGSYDAYEGKVRPAHSLLPDHKFPEISWDENTRTENPDNMTDEEIRNKFQLLDNQRNLEKREACRRVIQTGELGSIFGIDYHIDGVELWPKNIPKVGKKSEEGWKFCPWYDIEAWRKSLNEHLGKKSKDKK